MDLSVDNADAFTANVDRRLKRIFICSKSEESQENNHYDLWFQLVKINGEVEGEYILTQHVF